MTTPSLRLLQNAMTAYTWRLQALSTNIANLDTPGAARQTVSFEDTLQRARHDRAAVTAQRGTEDRPPLLEDEMMELADTQMRTQLASRALHDQFALLRTGITGRAS